jgi:hydroxymethylpyrimidine pyrophosphatase-like HAD family hydrolase
VHHDEIDCTVEKLRTEIESHGMRAQYIVSGMGEYLYLDVLSIRAGKRNAMDYVRKMFSISKERVVAAGDSGNDVLMLEGVRPTILSSS